MNRTLTTTQVAHVLGVTTARIGQLARAGRLRCRRDLMGRRLYARRDVERLLEQRRRRGLAPQVGEGK